MAKGFVNSTSVSAAPIGAVLTRAQELLTCIHLVQEWLQLTRILRKCADHGLSGFIEALENISAKRAPAVFQRCFYKAWASAAIGGSEPLVEFIGAGRTELTQKLRDLDQKTRKLQVTRIRAAACTGAQRVCSAQGDLGEIGEVAILQRELQKKKRFRPLRKLFADTQRPAGAQALLAHEPDLCVYVPETWKLQLRFGHL